MGDGEAADPWAEYDAERQGRSPVTASVSRFAFYGRCSTEDLQDPETSYNWQLMAAQSAILPVEGRIVAKYFDTGLSRSVPWKRRPEASRLLDDMRDPNRRWEAVVVGESQRCWYGSQFSDVAPLAQDRGVIIWLPDVGGPYDPDNPTHQMLMSVNGGMSRGERQRVQERVRLAMASQVRLAGRHQGGRPPYGYETVSAGPHPNPRKAAEGFTLRKLEPVPDRATHVQWIFAEYLDGASPRSIARALNERGVLCPSAADPARNPHRPKDGWQTSTVMAILRNPKYTGFQVWGRWHKEEHLLDPEDPSMGYVSRLMRSDAAPTRSLAMAHEPIISVDTFVRTQEEISQRAAAAARSKRYRPRERVAKPGLLFQGRILCAHCGRKMAGEERRYGVRYRCRVRDVTGVTKNGHPQTASISQALVAAPVKRWIVDILAIGNIEATTERLVDAQHQAPALDPRHGAISAEIEQEKVRLGNLVEAVASGADVQALREALIASQTRLGELVSELTEVADRDAASRVPNPPHDAIRRRVEKASALTQQIQIDGDDASWKELFAHLGIKLIYDSTSRVVRCELLGEQRGFKGQLPLRTLWT